jgi:hypothetical protein
MITMAASAKRATTERMVTVRSAWSMVRSWKIKRRVFFFFFHTSTLCCSVEGICPGGDDEELVIVPVGYYPLPSPDNPVILEPCRNSSPTSNPCNPESSPDFVCEVTKHCIMKKNS